MYEYVNVSVSSYDPGALAAKLTEKSAEGWEVVAIVPTGGDTTAFLRKAATATAPAAAEVAPVAQAEPAPAPAPSPVDEPAGWAAQPEPTPATPQPASTAPYQPSAQPTVSAQPTAVQPSAQPAQTTAAAPAGWYHDPSGRFELRYWDGGQWTEHVARGGQQFTDPPVAG